MNYNNKFTVKIFRTILFEGDTVHQWSGSNFLNQITLFDNFWNQNTIR